MTPSTRSKLVLPVAALGFTILATHGWRTLNRAEGLQAAGIVTTTSAAIAPDAEPVEVEVELAELPVEDSDEATQGREPRATDPEGDLGASHEDVVPEFGVLAVSIELPPKLSAALESQGVALTAVLDQPRRSAVPRGWRMEADAPLDGSTLLLQEVPTGTEFRLRLLDGKNVHAEARIQSELAARTAVKLDLASKARDEAAAVATLRSIAAAQQQLQASAAIDTDADGGGEHGYFAELAGAKAFRSFSLGVGAIYDPLGQKLDPSYLPKAFGALTPTSRGGVMERSGYAFLMFLPDDASTAPIRGLAESSEGGAGLVLPGSANGEIYWCCYAWPLEASVPAKRVFMINQAGDVLGSRNDRANAYVGPQSAPSFDAAFSNTADMSSELGMAAAGKAAVDGQIWMPVGN